MSGGTTSQKIKHLEGLRGLAAFQVVFHHFVLAFFPALFFGYSATHLKAGEELTLSGSIFNLIYNGNFAVCIFFVLSGFVLSYKFFLEKNHLILTERVIKRYVRLVMPAALSILIAYILLKFNLFYNQQAADISGSDWFKGFWTFGPNIKDALNQIFIGTFFTDIFAYNAVLWAIAVEFFGSLLVFGFLALCGTMRNRYLIYIFLAIFFLQTYYLAFILGVLLSDLMAHKYALIKKFDKNKLARIALLIFGLFLGSYPSGRAVDGTIYALIHNNYFSEFDVFCHIIGAFLVILVLLNSKRVQKFFSWKYFLFLGEISFGMYVLHFLILGSFSSFLFLKISPHVPYIEAVLISFALSAALIFSTAYFAYIYVDKKAVRLSNLIFERVFK